MRIFEIKSFFDKHFMFPSEKQFYSINSVLVKNMNMLVTSADTLGLWCKGMGGGQKKKDLHPHRECECTLCKKTGEMRYIHIKNYQHNSSYMKQVSKLNSNRQPAENECICKRCHDKEQDRKRM